MVMSEWFLVFTQKKCRKKFIERCIASFCSFLEIVKDCVPLWSVAEMCSVIQGNERDCVEIFGGSTE